MKFLHVIHTVGSTMSCTWTKAFLPLVLGGMLLLGGCSNDKTLTDDTVPYAVVGFRVQGASPSTRAGSTGTGQVNAVIVNGRMTDESGARGEVLLDGSTLYRLKGTENHFDYSPHVYFPSWAEQASFAAYSPASSRVGSESFTVSWADNPSDNVISYSVPSPAKGDLIGDVDVAPQEDLLVAAKKTKQEDFVAPVVLNMHHALSRVHVRARNMMVYPVIITKLSLHNLYNSGTLKVDGDIWGNNGTADIDEGYKTPPLSGHGDYKVLWTPTGEPNKALAWQLAESGVTAPVGVSTVQVTADDQAMLVMPQTTQNTNNDAEANPGDFYLEVTYTVQDYGSYTKCCAFRDVNGLQPDVIKQEGLTFEMGRQYALTLTFTADKLTFNVSVNEWDQPAVDVEVVIPKVEFKANEPERVTDPVTGIHAANSDFIYGQPLPTLTGGVPTLPGWIFLGYFDVNGTQYFDADGDGNLIVAAPNGTFNGTTWDKDALPIQYLYAQWTDHLWSRSNIYFQPDDPTDPNCSVGSLTFSEDDSSQKGYQGLYFKWGSLIGVAAGGNGENYNTTESTGTYLYIPSISTGKYYKVRAGLVSVDYTDGNPEKQDAVQEYAKEGSGHDSSWGKIPYVENGSGEGQIDATGAGRSDKRLTERSTATKTGLYRYYKGDICKFLSENKFASKLTRNWVMPKSEIWDAVAGNYSNGTSTNYNWHLGSLTNTTPDGTDESDVCLTYTTTTSETVTFPASGYRSSGDGALGDVGFFGNYWSSSVSGASYAYYLYFNSSFVDPARNDGRAWGRSVRCVLK